MRELEVVRTGPHATVQDLGRPGLAALGVGRSGAADRASLRLANRLVGNEESAAAIEATLGGLGVRAQGGLLVAVTGAPCPVAVDRRGVATNAPVHVPSGATVTLGAPPVGLRSYLAVRGGLAVRPELGSRSCDVMAHLGPDPLARGDRLPVGDPPERQPGVDHAAVTPPQGGPLDLRVIAGPRADWFSADAIDTLTSGGYEVTAESDRIGMRLAGPALTRVEHRELPSEGMVSGALQVPASGLPTMLLCDFPLTGGYPVVAVVVSADIRLAAQARPGQHLRFHEVPAPLISIS